MKFFKKYFHYSSILILLISSLFVGYLAYAKGPSDGNFLKVAFLDIGQGDSIYIEAPNGKQMLIDAGPGATILQRLPEVMPFGDRSIDMIMETHADSDHIGGFAYVFSKYKIDDVIENGVEGKTTTYKKIEKEIKQDKLKKIIANNKMRIVLDKSPYIYLDILYPNRDVSGLASNDGSIVAKLVDGKESFMLTGDATTWVENQIIWKENPAELEATVLKLGHHGSKTASSLMWLKAVSPNIAIISAGLNNRYHLPNQEILDRLKNLNIPYLATYKEGNIIFKTDGVKLYKE